MCEGRHRWRGENGPEPVLIKVIARLYKNLLIYYPIDSSSSVKPKQDIENESWVNYGHIFEHQRWREKNFK